MKRNLFFCICVICSSILFNTHAEDDTGCRLKIDSIFQHIDLSTVETGILFDHGINLIEPSFFNGQLKDTVYSDKDILKTLYAGLADSKVNTYCQLDSVDEVFTKIEKAENISILYIAYNALSQLAYDNGIIYIEDEQLKIDNTKKGNIFDYNYCFAVALGNTEFVGKTVSLPIVVDNLITNQVYRFKQQYNGCGVSRHSRS